MKIFMRIAPGQSAGYWDFFYNVSNYVKYSDGRGGLQKWVRCGFSSTFPPLSPTPFNYKHVAYPKNPERIPQ